MRLLAAFAQQRALVNTVLTKIPTSQFRRAASMSLGLAALWVGLAFLRSGSTFHLAPILVAGAFPVVLALDAQDQISTRHLALAAMAGLAASLGATLLLTVADEMTGVSLLPFGGAVTEAVIFSLAGAIGGFAIGALLRNR